MAAPTLVQSQAPGLQIFPNRPPPAPLKRRARACNRGAPSGRIDRAVYGHGQLPKDHWVTRSPIGCLFGKRLNLRSAEACGDALETQRRVKPVGVAARPLHQIDLTPSTVAKCFAQLRDQILILALLRPAGRDHFTLEDLFRGFRTVSSMLEGRRDRGPVATVSFLGARSNRLIAHENGDESSLESVLDAMHKAGFEGDLYPPVSAWDVAPTGVFASYPFPESLDRMREGSS